MERILIIGSPGAGKSTLAADVARLTGLPLVHLDQHYWQPGWIETAKPEWEERVAELIKHPHWVMDGNYGGTLPLRLGRADTVIWLDLPVWLCLARIVRRAIVHRGRVRPDMAEGCPEQLSWEFFSYTARFRRAGRNRILDKLRGFSGTLLHLRTRRDAIRFLERLSPGAPAGAR